ncbi:Alcohol dehydrogenase superfamily, zinc-type [Niveomyces insectorum RCEF 264]|uniref:Alcohol dehydrogenase superfamily, zinc-type n=1 Tax=Niveomyces insectorum RCEF 264 TaxID=1081102 RepID=A0A167MNH0_9HYPO|nr:Alcohol dehydrogenase superfamily, zinc-type [Niveomyces insectorum RCEF 264]
MASTTVRALSLPVRMNAQLLDGFNKPYVLRSVHVPVPSDPHDLLVRVDAASYCHTDAVLAAGKMPPYPRSFPHVGCHEFAGTVVALPPQAANTASPAWRVGDRVGVPGRTFHPCGTCFECQAAPTPQNPDADPPGYSVYCPHGVNNGISGPGGFREYALVDSRQVAPIPASMSSVDTAVLMCAGVTVYAALKRCRLAAGQRVAIMGCGGGLGHLGLQFAIKMGLRVVGVDAADEPLQLARDVVADVVADVVGAGASNANANDAAMIVDARTQASADVVAQLGQADGKTDTADAGVDAVVLLPESQQAFDYGVGLLRNHGLCVVVSFPPDGFRISARDVVFRDISIVGSLVGSNKTLREMLDFAAQHEVQAHIKTYPLSRLNDLVAEYEQGGGGKLVVDMSLNDPDGTDEASEEGAC